LGSGPSTDVKLTAPDSGSAGQLISGTAALLALDATPDEAAAADEDAGPADDGASSAEDVAVCAELGGTAEEPALDVALSTDDAVMTLMAEDARDEEASAWADVAAPASDRGPMDADDAAPALLAAFPELETAPANEDTMPLARETLLESAWLCGAPPSLGVEGVASGRQPRVVVETIQKHAATTRRVPLKSMCTLGCMVLQWRRGATLSRRALDAHGRRWTGPSQTSA